MNPTSRVPRKDCSCSHQISVADTAASHSTKRSDRLHTVALVDDEEWDRIRGSQILVKSGKFHSVNPYASAEEALREIPGGQSQSRLRGQSRVPSEGSSEGSVPGIDTICASAAVGAHGSEITRGV